MVNKAKRDSFDEIKHVSYFTKITAVVCITAVLAGMLLYIVLFALNQTNDVQSAWFSSFMLWLFIEVCLSSTNSVLLTHVLLPSIAASDVDKIKMRLVEAVRRYQVDLIKSTAGSSPDRGVDGKHINMMSNAEFLVYQEDTTPPTTQQQFQSRTPSHSPTAAHKTLIFPPAKVTELNAAKYLHVSHRLSSQLPSIAEAQIITRLVTVYPRRSYQPFDLTMSAALRIITFSGSFTCIRLLNMPTIVQDMVVELVCIIGTGYVVLLHVDLWANYPALIALPLLIVFIVALCVVVIGRRTAIAKTGRLNNLLEESASKRAMNSSSNCTNSNVRDSEGNNQRSLVSHHNVSNDGDSNTAMLPSSSSNKMTGAAKSWGNSDGNISFPSAKRIVEDELVSHHSDEEDEEDDDVNDGEEGDERGRNKNPKQMEEQRDSGESKQ